MSGPRIAGATRLFPLVGRPGSASEDSGMPGAL